MPVRPAEYNRPAPPSHRDGWGHALVTSKILQGMRAMERFLQQLNTIPEVAELVRRVEEGGCPAAVTGLQPVQRACVGAAVARGTDRPAVFICGDEREARQLSGDLETLLGEKPVLLLS